eukprot:scaffold43165_cov20-Tisochrysis_lutea.AAC.2
MAKGADVREGAEGLCCKRRGTDVALRLLLESRKCQSNPSGWDDRLGLTATEHTTRLYGCFQGHSLQLRIALSFRNPRFAGALLAYLVQAHSDGGKAAHAMTHTMCESVAGVPSTGSDQ